MDFTNKKRNLFFFIYRGRFSFLFLCAGSVFGLLRGRAPRAAFPPLFSSLAARSGGRGPLPARAPSAAGCVCLGSIPSGCLVRVWFAAFLVCSPFSPPLLWAFYIAIFQ